jgi:hypothetical protein
VRTREAIAQHHFRDAETIDDSDLVSAGAAAAQRSAREIERQLRSQ